ncbi:peptidoglycan editing factor PgeF [Caldicellulosiruptor acetigenus]|uniref:Purine nucleoside phosphorylase n=1 Tax=Caldicellulosiruptor acetigenus 6A TaxID=632516 RepID=G2PUB7_9FIRM|nr:peptidoglycan editing factor PgeF [Caldicellulosiruptor acetigenus]AEM73509.1 Multi-copper polyphenol oxidoreductase, laccase [Caldicellulosiruptor acetigenus 6A]
MGFVKENINGIEIFRINEFEDYGIEGFFTTRQGCGHDNFNLSYKWAERKEDIDKNFRILFEALQIDYRNIFYAKQVHKNDIIIVERGFDFFEYNQEAEADGLVTNVPGITLITMHADCIPVYIVDTKTRVISLIHSGWRGTLKHITQNALAILKKKFSSSAEDLLVAIGPGICRRHFEVGKDVYEMFLREFGDEVCLESKESFFIDLKKAIMIDLKKNGIGNSQIICCEMCTYENEDLFFSYRRDHNKPERLGSMVAILRMVRK